MPPRIQRRDLLTARDSGDLVGALRAHIQQPITLLCGCEQHPTALKVLGKMRRLGVTVEDVSFPYFKIPEVGGAKAAFSTAATCKEVLFVGR